MTAPACSTIRRRFAVGKYSATMTVPIVEGTVVGLEIEWDAPSPPKLRPRDFVEYRKKRNAILQSVADKIGGPIVLADLNPDGGFSLNKIYPTASPQAPNLEGN